MSFATPLILLGLLAIPLLIWWYAGQQRRRERGRRRVRRAGPARVGRPRAAPAGAGTLPMLAFALALAAS